MDRLDHVLRRMGRHATALLPFSLLVGIVFQDLAAAMRPLVGPLSTLLLMLALMRTDWPRVRALLQRPALALVLSAALLVAVPLVVWPFWSLMPIWHGLIAALCLSAMAPTVISAPTTATFLRLDNSLALLIALITNFAVPLTLPPLALWLLNLDLHISVGALSLRLLTIVVVAVVGAIALRAWLGRDRLRHNAERIDGLSIALLIVYAIPLMDGVIARAMAEPIKLGGFVAGSFAGALLSNALMVLGCLSFLDPRSALTAGYCSGSRNNALLMAVLPAVADKDIFLFIAAVQVPIYVIPTLLQPLYRRLLRPQPTVTTASSRGVHVAPQELHE
jgi:BASS family bile acid:Na+ symporter